MRRQKDLRAGAWKYLDRSPAVLTSPLFSFFQRAMARERISRKLPPADPFRKFSETPAARLTVNSTH